MNTFIAAAAGSVVSFVVLVGGVNVYQASSSSDAVAPQDLYTYADE